MRRVRMVLATQSSTTRRSLSPLLSRGRHNPHNSAAASWWLVRDSQMTRAPSACRRFRSSELPIGHSPITKSEGNAAHLCRHRDLLLYSSSKAALDFRFRHNDLWGVWAVAGSAICDMAGSGPGRFLAGSAGVSRRFRGPFRAVPWAAPDGSGRFLPVYVAAVLQFEFWIPRPLVDNWGSPISF